MDVNEAGTVEAPIELDTLELEAPGDIWSILGDGVLKAPPEPSIETRLSNFPSS